MSMSRIGPTWGRDGHKVVTEVHKDVNQMPVVDVVAVLGAETLNKPEKGIISMSNYWTPCRLHQTKKDILRWMNEWMNELWWWDEWNRWCTIYQVTGDTQMTSEVVPVISQRNWSCTTTAFFLLGICCMRQWNSRWIQRLHPIFFSTLGQKKGWWVRDGKLNSVSMRTEMQVIFFTYR